MKFLHSTNQCKKNIQTNFSKLNKILSSKVLLELLGREATEKDAKNCTKIHNPIFRNSYDYIFLYKGIKLGKVEFDFANNRVDFIPKTERKDDKS